LFPTSASALVTPISLSSIDDALLPDILLTAALIVVVLLAVGGRLEIKHGCLGGGGRTAAAAARVLVQNEP
jgi:hypothetical protein